MTRSRTSRSTGNSGSVGTVYGVLDYNLSKRTDVYVELDNTKLSDGEINGNSPLATSAATRLAPAWLSACAPSSNPA